MTLSPSLLNSRIELSHLPVTWLQPPLRNQISDDAQFYYRCEKCHSESRVPLLLVGEKKFLKETCSNCRAKGKWKPVTHALKVTTRCLDCDLQRSAVHVIHDLWRCDRCYSARFEVLSEETDPPYPERFFEFDSPFVLLANLGAKQKIRHAWGVSPQDDANRIHAESQCYFGPDQHRYCYSLVLFARRVYLSYGPDDVEGQFLLMNILGNLSQDYLRTTGSLFAGLLAVSCFGSMAGIVDGSSLDTLNKALAQHSLAMAVYSVLVLYGETPLADYFEDPAFRLLIIAQAKESAQAFEAAAQQGAQNAASQVARIQFVIGDLLRIGHATDDQRHEALSYFRLALHNEWFKANLQVGAADSFADTVLALTAPTHDQLVEAESLLSGSMQDIHHDRQLNSLWRYYFALSLLQRKLDLCEKAGQSARKAVEHALQQFSAVDDENLLLKQAETFVPVFEDFACTLAAQGFRDEALSTIELSRAASIRLYTMDKDSRKKHLKEIQARQLEDLVPPSIRQHWNQNVGAESQRYIRDFLWDHPIEDAIGPVLTRFGDHSCAFYSVFVSQEIITGIFWARSAAGKFTLDALQWEMNEEALIWLRSQRYVDPGPFRERLLNKACNLTYQQFIQPMAHVLEAVSPRHLLISFPGLYSRLPIEAAVRMAFTSRPAPEIGLSYLPSLRLGADISSRSAARRVPSEMRVLVIAYEGDDMPGVQAETERLRAIWADRLTILHGSQATKRTVLESLLQPYDIVHFMSHGTYDPSNPMDSALHFTTDTADDSRRLTAADLLMLPRLQRSPTIVLSACSSGLTADSRTNSFHGLPGSFFRIGARAIVGSRWPVHDEAASSIMARFHQEISASSDPLDLLLDRARQAPGDPANLEDSAAFGVFGMP